MSGCPPKRRKPGRAALKLPPACCPRRNPSRSGVARLLAPFSAACFLLACGIQGPPKPPRVQRPEPVADLKAAQVGRGIEIRFTPPELAVDGERLTKPLEIEILRDVTTSGPPQGVGKPPATLWVALNAHEWPRDVRGGVIVYSARLSAQEFAQWQGATLVLAVRTLTRGFRYRRIESDLSNRVQVVILDVSRPVENLEPHTTEKAIELSWTPPTRSLGGQPLRDLAGYRIYRSRTGKPGSFELRGEAAAPPYLDGDFEFGRTYFYKVRAVFSQKGRSSESEDSPPASVTPLDIFPPAAPAGLTALYAAGSVDLVWNANTDRDLAGYHVFRRADREQARRLNQELLRTPIFRDQAVEPGHTYSYYVTAVDLTGNESTPSAEVSVETR